MYELARLLSYLFSKFLFKMYFAIMVLFLADFLITQSVVFSAPLMRTQGQYDTHRLLPCESECRYTRHAGRLYTLSIQALFKLCLSMLKNISCRKYLQRISQALNFVLKRIK